MEMIYGEKTPYDPDWNGPEQSRRITDPNAFKIFKIFFLSWSFLGFICSVTYDHDEIYTYVDSESFLNESILTSHFKKIDSFPRALYDVVGKFSYEILVIILSITITGILAIAYIKLMRYTKCIFKTCMSILTFLSFIVFLISLYIKDITCITVGGILFLWPVLVWISYREKMKDSCKIIKDALIVEKYFRFTNLKLTVAQCLVVFVLFIFYCSIYIKITVLTSGKISTILCSLNLLICVYLLSFILMMKKMVMSLNYASWYWTHNKSFAAEDISNNSVQLIRGYHLGTIAAGSIAIILALPFLCLIAIIRRIAELITFERYDDYIIYSLRYFCNSFPMFTVYVNEGAFTISAIHGTDFYESGRVAFNMTKRKSAKTLAPTELASSIFTVGLIFIEIISAGVTYKIMKIMISSYGITDLEISKTIMITLMFDIYVIHCIFKTMSVAIETLYYCILEDFERNDGSIDRPYFMSPQLSNLAET